MSDPLHELQLVAVHPDHGSHGQTYQATVGATSFGGLLVVAFGILTLFEPPLWPLFAAALLGTVFTGLFAYLERQHTLATLPRLLTLEPHRLVVDGHAVPLEGIVTIEQLERPPWLVIHTADRHLQLPPAYQVHRAELQRFRDAIDARRVALEHAEARPDAKRALEVLTGER